MFIAVFYGQSIGGSQTETYFNMTLVYVATSAHVSISVC